MNKKFDISKVKTFESLSKKTLAALKEAAIYKKLKKGKTIFVEKSRAEGLYFLISGQIGVYKTLKNEQVLLHKITGNEIFGEISLINKMPHKNFAIAEKTSEYILIPKDKFEKIIQKDPNAAIALSISISRKLSELRHKIVSEKNKTTIVSIYNEGNPHDKAWLAMETALYLQDIHKKPEAKLTKEIQTQKKVLLIDLTSDPRTLENILKQKFDYDFIIINLPPKKDAVSASLIFNSNYLINISNKKLGFYKKLFNGNLRIIDIDLKHDRKLERIDWRIGNIARTVSKSTIGVALGSGTVGGICHIGALKCLEEKQIPIDMISGCSGGAVYGSLYAFKKDQPFVEKTVKKHATKSFIKHLDFAWSKQGLSKGTNIQSIFTKTFGKTYKIENLKIPFAITTTNITKQEEKIFIKGDLWKAMNASFSIPIIFKPVKIKNNYYSDGNITNPLPVDNLKKNGIDKTIAVYATQKNPTNKINNALDVYFRSRAIMNDAKALESAKKANIFINPDVTGIDTFDYKKFDVLLKRGYQAANKNL